MRYKNQNVKGDLNRHRKAAFVLISEWQSIFMKNDQDN